MKNLLIRLIEILVLAYAIVVIEFPFLTFISLHGIRAIGSPELIDFIRNYQNVYNGTYAFSFADIMHGNLELLYFSLGMLSVMFCYSALARYFQYKDYLFYKEHTMDEIFLGKMYPRGTGVSIGNAVRALLWSVIMIPLWPVFVIWSMWSKSLIRE